MVKGLWLRKALCVCGLRKKTREGLPSIVSSLYHLPLNLSLLLSVLQWGHGSLMEMGDGGFRMWREEFFCFVSCCSLMG